jgi:hypothetical protein
MPESPTRSVTQKAFLAAAGQALDAGEVRYEHPGLFSLPAGLRGCESIGDRQ